MIPPSYDLQPIKLSKVRHLFETFHAYGSLGNTATYCFAVIEDGSPVAAFTWQPPAPGSARSVFPVVPQGVLALSRMVAVPREQRRLRHISKPLRRQMRMMIDRTRWPALVTYSDASMGHTGHVYKCAGWQKAHESTQPIYEDSEGRRVSEYCAGSKRKVGKTLTGHKTITRWEHWIVPRDQAAFFMADHGWRREPIPGKTWRSGRQAYAWKKGAPQK